MNKTSILLAAAGFAVTATTAMADDKPQLAFVVNAASDFWKLAEAGVNAAQAELPGYELQFRYPAQGTAALQNALMDDLVAAGTDARLPPKDPTPVRAAETITALLIRAS